MGAAGLWKLFQFDFSVNLKLLSKTSLFRTLILTLHLTLTLTLTLALSLTLVLTLGKK